MGSAVLLGLLCYLSLKYYTKTKAVCKPTVFLSLGKYKRRVRGQGGTREARDAGLYREVQGAVAGCVLRSGHGTPTLAVIMGMSVQWSPMQVQRCSWVCIAAAPCGWILGAALHVAACGHGYRHCSSTEKHLFVVI